MRENRRTAQMANKHFEWFPFVCVCVWVGFMAGSGCSARPVAHGTTNKSLFPGHAPPPMDELLNQALAAGPPKASSLPYTMPPKIQVPPLERPRTEILPATDDGKPVLENYGGMLLVMDETLADPITAQGDCMSLVSHCIEPRNTPNGRTLDACFASVPICKTQQPWGESEPCCSEACRDLYRTLRERNFADTEAFERTIDTNCFPGVKEFMARSKP